MAVAAETLRVNIEAKDRATPVLRLVKNEVKEINDGFKLLNPTILGTTIGIGSLVGILTKAVREFQEAEVAQKKLTIALQNAGVASKDYQGFLEGVANRLQALTGFSDEQITAAQAMLVQFGFLGEGLEEATKLALDLSVAFGVNLETAAQALGKAYQGNFRGLQALGIKIDETLPKSEALEKAFDQLRQRIGGQAEGSADTLTGAFRALGGHISDFFKALGGGIAGQTGAGPGSVGLTQLVKDVNTLISDWKDILGITKQITPEQTKAAEQVNKQAKAAERVKKAQEDYLIGLDKIIERGKIGEEFWKNLGDELQRIQGIMDDTNSLESQMAQHFDSMAENAQKTRDAISDIEKIEDRRLQHSNRLGSAALSSSSASGLTQVGLSAAGMAGGMAGLIGLVVELVEISGELPEKLDGMIDGLAKGISEGIPKLIDYLASDFLPHLILGLGQAFASLITNIGDVLIDLGEFAARSSAAALTLGFSELGIALADWLSGGDGNRRELTPEEVEELRNSGLDLEQKAIFPLIEQLTELETERFEMEIEAQEEILQAAQRSRDAMISLKNSALSAIQSAIAVVGGAFLSPEANVSQLRANLRSAGSPQERSSAAAALAGGLQGQFSAAQNLAGIGAISGEELARIQKDVLGQLETLESETISEFDRLISIQEDQMRIASDQLATLRAGFDAFIAQMESLRETVATAANTQIGLLADIRHDLRERITGFGAVPARPIRENIGNIRGVIRAA